MLRVPWADCVSPLRVHLHICALPRFESMRDVNVAGRSIKALRRDFPEDRRRITLTARERPRRRGDLRGRYVATLRFVAVKSSAQQDAQAVRRVRQINRGLLLTMRRGPV